ncbi:hypothetical protein TELCIR_15108, partial [Teladorsagia circumcincta]
MCPLPTRPPSASGSTWLDVCQMVKCTSNARIEIDDCADILLPGNEVQVTFRKKGDSCGNDELMVVYCLVGKQWLAETSSAF